ncbi:extracellular solute-binding protein [Paenibacillus albidus]|uniref:ABC transporter substrate-binding protein n=1 Tax=Paenibacillus albidus TaxID=2041023 RepID=UPI001BE6176B|nr:extracellular solute-binding protein [Paenibacillus albidus]MBT2288999.1 extracellular solute-binding protein [Paenibacillus albidus]
MKRMLAVLCALLICGWVVYIAVYDRPPGKFDSGPADEISPKTQIKVALHDWTQNLEVKNAIERYNQTNPDQIEILIMDISTDVYNDTLNMLITSGQGPDVFSVDNEWLATYVNKDYLANLSPYLEPAELSRFPEWAVDLADRSLFKGGIYFLPASVETLRFIYNKDLFRSAGLDPEHPPVTFAEMKDAAARISEAGVGVNKHGFALAGGDGQESLETGLEMSGTYSGIYHYSYRTGRYDLSVYKSWLQMVLDLKAQGSLYPGENLLKRDTALRQFAEGNIGMMYVTSKDYVKLQEYMPKPEWGVVLPPAADSSKAWAGALMMMPQSPLVVNALAPARAEAVKVWKFLQSEEFLTLLYRQGLALPVVDGILDTPAGTGGLAHFKEFYPTRVDSIYPLTPQIMDQYDPSTVSIEPRASGDRSRMQLYLHIIAGEKTLDQALKEETERLNQMLDIADTGYYFKREEYIYPGFDPRHPLLAENLLKSLRGRRN